MAPGQKPKRTAGRPSLLTPEVQSKICNMLSIGNFRKIACKSAGISHRVFNDWMRIGQDESSGPHRDFREAVLSAESKAEIFAVDAIISAGKRDPRHLEWWLSHRFPERWADKSRAEYRAALKLQHSGMVANVDISMEDLSKLTDEEVRLVERILAKLPEVADSNKGDKNSGGGKK